MIVDSFDDIPNEHNDHKIVHELHRQYLARKLELLSSIS